MTPGRRTLRYDDLDEVMPDVERLLPGHRTVGRWTLGQICHHLGSVMRRVVDLPPPAPGDPPGTFDADLKARVFAEGRLVEGLPLATAPGEPKPLDDRAGAEFLREAIAHYRSSPGPAAPHRLLGPLTAAEWGRLQLIHGAHHLSFAVPTSPQGTAG